VAAIVEIGSGDAFNAGQRDGIGKKAGTLHANADDAEAEAVACRNRGFERGRNMRRLNQDVSRDGKRTGGACSFLQKLTASGFHYGLRRMV